MLTRLDIQGLAIIDTLSIEFSRGFNVITGETGAGKSILIKALGLLLGSKASSDTVRRGKDTATVTGFFEVPRGHKSTVILTDFGIPCEDPGDEAVGLLIRRTITNKGRSSAWVNDVPVTATVLRELASCLMDVFGQHDNLKILDPSQHIHYVDLFLKDPDILDDYQAALEATNTLREQIETLLQSVLSSRRDADYLAFRCAELKTFAPDELDYEHVRNFCQRGSHFMQLVSGLEKARAAIDQGADGEPLSRLVWDASRLLAKLESLSDVAKPLADEAGMLASRLDDLSFNIGKAMSGVDVDERDLEAAETRLAGYQEMFRKLSVADIQGLLTEQERLQTELNLLETSGFKVLDLLRELKSQTSKTRSLALRLSKARQKAKDLVKKRLASELTELAMPEASIDVELLPVSKAATNFGLESFDPEALTLWKEISLDLASLGENGAERAQFLLSTNKGEGMLPLQKIASGGEISRVMLALKKALAAGADSCILVFDEIDSGISGRVADVVGRKMQELASDFQVICISHLAQVAAHAETHFLVHKFGRGDRTESTISALSRKDSEAEVARLLSGDEVTDTSLANARALIRKARTTRDKVRDVTATL
jgi:DNA repair protein RecN (Recombination protein N)